jgi:hypothetical protein
MLRHYHLRRHRVGETEPAVYWYEVIESNKHHPLGVPAETSLCVLHSEASGRIVCDRLSHERLAGVIEGIERFAWWMDGEQYVGTCGTTLKRAVEDLKAERF